MAVDPSTGSVSLRAEFPNPRNILLPGQFVRAQVDIGSLREGILIPQIAVKMADSGASVFVVDKKGHAVPRSIRLGEMQGDKWVVLAGLRHGEKIVTNGVQKVMAGKPVRVAGSPSAPAPRRTRPDRAPMRSEERREGKGGD